MNEYIIKFNNKELNNLKIFLSRVTLSGNEALEFVKLVQKIENPQKVGDEKNGK